MANTTQVSKRHAHPKRPPTHRLSGQRINFTVKFGEVRFSSARASFFLVVISFVSHFLCRAPRRVHFTRQDLSIVLLDRLRGHLHQQSRSHTHLLSLSATLLAFQSRSAPLEDVPAHACERHFASFTFHVERSFLEHVDPLRHRLSFSTLHFYDELSHLALLCFATLIVPSLVSLSLPFESLMSFRPKFSAHRIWSAASRHTSSRRRVSPFRCTIPVKIITNYIPKPFLLANKGWGVSHLFFLLSSHHVSLSPLSLLSIISRSDQLSVRTTLFCLEGQRAWALASCLEKCSHYAERREFV